MEMKKIAVLTCRNVGLTCTGGGCFKVFNDKEKSFEIYKGQDIQMSAFFDCSGCDADKMADPGFARKMSRLKDLNVEVVHLANCILSDCKEIDRIKEALTANGIAYTEGTH